MSNAIDLTGQRFGMLTVIERDFSTQHKNVRWWCKCDCGNTKSISANHLKEQQSCGCKTPRANLEGKTFGLLKVLRYAYTKNNHAYWDCLCQCGRRKTVATVDLTKGHVSSCGCLKKKNCYGVSIRKPQSHGMSHTKIYKRWEGMLYRCENPNSSNYQHYGGKGIKVCDKWHDVLAFADWAYKNGFNEEKADRFFQLDRIDPNGDYCPENCRWVDMRTQQNNKTSTIYVTVDGINDSLANWARKYEISEKVVYERIKKLGWNPVDAIKTPKAEKSAYEQRSME